MANDRNEPAGEKPSPEEELSELRKTSAQLKAKIAEARARNDMPLDSTLGNPGWDHDAADGHLDLPDNDDDAWPRPPANGDKP